MADLIEKSIESFRAYFSLHIEATREIGSSRNLQTHKKLVYSAILDALSMPVFLSCEKPNRKRFENLIVNFSGWEDSCRVSVPHLFKFLLMVEDPRLNDLQAVVSGELSSWKEGELVGLSHDIKLEDVKTHWPRKSSCVASIKGREPKSFLHSFLLYKSRNSLVHEFRQPSFSFELSSDKKPYYLSCHSSDSVDWTLIYPVGFYDQLCQTSLTKVVEHCYEHGINPLSDYEFGSYWLPGLNS